MCSNRANNKPSNLSINVINDVEHVETILEQFFSYHANFLWERAKEYIEHERDTFRSAHHSHGSSILVSLMNALTQLTLADKNYLAAQFFSTKVFQRKDFVKCSYQSLEVEFQRLVERGQSIGQKSNSLPQTPHHHHHQQSTQCHQTASVTIPSEQAQDVLTCNVDELFSDSEKGRTSPIVSPSPEPNTPTIVKSKSLFSKIFRFSRQQQPTTVNSNSPNVNTSNSFLDESNFECTGDDSTNDSTAFRFELNLDSLDRFASHLSGQLISYVRVRIEMIDLYDKLSCVCPGRKFCLMNECLETAQVIHTKADRNFHHPVLNSLKAMFMFECDILLSLLKVHTNIQDWNFVDSLFFLQDAHNKLNMMANMRDSVISQYTTSLSAGGGGNMKLGVAASIPISPQSGGVTVGTSPAAGAVALRRNFTNSSLSSSGSSNLGLATPTPTSSLSGGGVGVNSHSPNPVTTMNFIYPNQYPAASYAPPSKSLFKSANSSSSTMPMLIQWLNRFKLFLLSKYSFYFHSLLMVHLTPSSIASSAPLSVSAFTASSANHNSSANYAAIESHMRHLCSKHPYDFHTRIVQFVRKCDSSYAILIFDTHGKEEFSHSGYRSPFFKKDLPKGINSYPIIYSYPGEFPKNRIPSLIMIMNDRIKELNTIDNVLVEYDKPSAASPSDISPIIGNNIVASQKLQQQQSAKSSQQQQQQQQQQLHQRQSQTPIYSSSSSASTSVNNSLPSATYFLIRPDPNFTLAMICEQQQQKQQKHETRDTQIVSFMQEMATLLKGSKIFAMLRSGSLK